ncbi:hypothetical protein PMZ73_17430 [[Clostridium] symbiosum]|uniref:Uncharacterized protein n=1 Tax=Clostridium symbiosum TaxID=1512 RepID=A0AAW6AXM2_CLOSY|nr:hypothetical protein [[Clostridium] symbiosum]MDB1979087.1 hypothetical protein [[Clostridium] symbiosum]MDB1983923.1 hypothetical protein [[Clostridium] symbiosum]MDB1988220.1 hypothetical protein [[Clostridium] symbiosum]MDB1992840.1 hypothetical protein [[Clostridium] symbiosum]MDB1997087.1 hypothetical protein [[Clostridium] symbiosum]
MKKDKLILKNGIEKELEAGGSLGALQVLSADRAEMLATWELLTPDNLSQVQIKNGAGLTVGTYTDLVLASEASVVASDGTVLTTYSLRPKTDVERLTERVAVVEEGQQVQDGAINDVAKLAGSLAEQAGGMS